jgi:hypothetical protein
MYSASCFEQAIDAFVGAICVTKCLSDWCNCFSVFSAGDLTLGWYACLAFTESILMCPSWFCKGTKRTHRLCKFHCSSMSYSFDSASSLICNHVVSICKRERELRCRSGIMCLSLPFMFWSLSSSWLRWVGWVGLVEPPQGFGSVAFCFAGLAW